MSNNAPNAPLPRNPAIAARVKEGIRNGVTVQTIFASIQDLQDAPGSLHTFYKLYRKDMEDARFLIVSAIGNKVVDQAINGDPKDGVTFKSQELYLRTQGGWTPKETLETRELGSEADEEESAINALLIALGKADDSGS